MDSARRAHFAACVCLALLVSRADAAQRPRSGGECQIAAHFTTQPPRMDGRLDDPCWSQADKATGFSKISGKELARAQTEVRVLYDVRNLYVGIVAFDQNIAKATFLPAAPNAHDTEGIFHQDEIEVFLDPPGEGDYQFCGTPAGAKWDGMAGMAGRWDADWTLAASIGSDRYVVELAIPFVELRHRDSLAGSPAPGDKWRVNFCRSKSYQGEWTCWSYTVRGFHKPERFGHMTFGPYPKGWTPLGAKPPARWLVGENQLTVVPLSNVLAPISLKAKLDRMGEPRDVGAGTIEPGPKGREAALSVGVPRSGEQRLVVEARQAGHVAYVAGAHLDLFDVAGSAREIAAAASAMGKEIVGISKQPDAFESGLLKKCETLQRHAEELSKQVGASAAVAPAKWDTWCSRVKDLQATQAAVAFEAARLRARRSWAEPESGDAPSAGVGVQSAMYKVFDDEPFAGVLAKEVSLEAAAGERESFQVTVMPVEHALKGVYLLPRDLVGSSGGRIAYDHIEWHVVRTVEVERAPFPIRRTGPHPDPLEPGRPFDVPVQRNQTCWVTVHVPAGTPAGEYQGEVEVVVPGVRTFPIRVKLMVWPFELPARNHLKLDFWYSGWATWCWYRTHCPTVEQFDRILDVLAKYRLVTYMTPRVNWCHIDIWKEPDGSFTFDYTTMDRYLEASFKHGLNAFNLNFSCNLTGLMAALKPDQCNVHNRKTGKVTKGKYGPDTLTQQQCRELFPKLLKDYIAHLKAKGWWDAAFIECVDEPGPDRHELMRRTYALLHETAPDLKRLSAAVGADHKLREHVEIYCPLTKNFRPAAAHAAQKAGKHSWWYVCCSPYPPYPNWLVPQDCAAHRVLLWQTWQQSVEGFLYWGVNQWWQGKPDECPQDPARRWPNGPFKLSLYGDGLMIYPGYRIGEPWPSIRLAMIRDGLEDYEYLWLLNERVNQAKRAGVGDKLVKEAQQILAVPAELTPDLKTYNRDPQVMLSLRRRAARLIVALGESLAK